MDTPTMHAPTNAARALVTIDAAAFLAWRSRESDEGVGLILTEVLKAAQTRLPSECEFVRSWPFIVRESEGAL